MQSAARWWAHLGIGGGDDGCGRLVVGERRAEVVGVVLGAHCRQVVGGVEVNHLEELV